MLRTAYQNIYAFWVKVANIGISEDLSFHEKKKTQLLNIVVAAGIPLNIFFSVLNGVHGKTLLAITNLLLFVGGVVILAINYYRKFLLSRLTLTFLGSVIFVIEAVFFGNGGEYFLLTNLLVIIIYFNERIYIFLISLFNCLLFIGIKIYLHSTSATYGTVPFGRVIFNMSLALTIMVLALLFFKKEQQDYQDEVEEKNDELQRLNETKQKLFSIIAHDLRSPIGQLRNSLDLVKREYISPEAFIQASSRLSSEVDQLHTTLDNLLRWSLSQFQGIKVVPEKIMIDELVDQKHELFKQSLETKNIRLLYEPSGLMIYADPDHLRLILRNLISNAIKYSYTDSTITIRSYAQRDSTVIEVRDNGIGMTKERNELLFTSNDIISNTGTSNEKGTGLGLKLCKEFVEKNNGQIWIESREQAGTSFYISFPSTQ